MSKYICFTASIYGASEPAFLCEVGASKQPIILNMKSLFKVKMQYSKHYKLHFFKLMNAVYQEHICNDGHNIDNYIRFIGEYATKVESCDIHPINTYVLMYDELYFHNEPTEGQESFCLTKNIKYAFKFEGTEDEANALFKKVEKVISTIVVKLIS